MFWFTLLIISTSSVFGIINKNNIHDETKEVFFNPHLGSVGRSQLMPNFFFFGVSKCGTSTMAELLTEHPLFTAVGTEVNVAYEANSLNKKFSIQDLKHIHMMRTNRVAKHLLSTNNDSLITEILKRGIIMDYTPNNAQNDLVLQNVFNSIPYYDKTQKIEDKKFLMMIRNPVTRTASSWWYKEWLKGNGTRATNASFGPLVQQGIEQEMKLKNCYLVNGFNFSELVKTTEGIHEMLQSNVLKKCGLKMLNTGGYAERRQHIGKSLYAHTLV
jgi:hypothetical protein